MWAGTHEHALTNYTARFHIWQHFDSFLRQDEEVDNQDDNENGDDQVSNGEEAAPSF